jgi:hypothetical protein
MATFTKPNIYTYYSNAAIPANVFVKLIDNDSIGVCGAGEFPLGITYSESTAIGQSQEVVISGGAKLKVGAALPVMSFVISAAAGVGAVGVQATAAAIVMEASTAANDIIEVKLLS